MRQQEYHAIGIFHPICCIVHVGRVLTDKPGKAIRTARSERRTPKQFSSPHRIKPENLGKHGFRECNAAPNEDGGSPPARLEAKASATGRGYAMMGAVRTREPFPEVSGNRSTVPLVWNQYQGDGLWIHRSQSPRTRPDRVD